VADYHQVANWDSQLILKINKYYIRKGREKQNYITENFGKNKKCEGQNLKRIEE